MAKVDVVDRQSMVEHAPVERTLRTKSVLSHGEGLGRFGEEGQPEIKTLSQCDRSH